MVCILKRTSFYVEPALKLLGALQLYCFLYFQRQIAVIIQKEPETSETKGKIQRRDGGDTEVTCQRNLHPF